MLTNGRSSATVLFIMCLCTVWRTNPSGEPPTPPSNGNPIQPPNDEIKTGNSVSSEQNEDDDRLTASGELLRRILNPSIYHKYVRPKGLNGTGSPVKVVVSLLIRNVENVDDVNMEYNLQMTFRQSWIDPRLFYAHTHSHIPSLQLINDDYIWIPDIFFSNEKEGKAHELMVPNFFGRIYPSGEVLVSYRISLRLSCPMTLQQYPMVVKYFSR